MTTKVAFKNLHVWVAATAAMAGLLLVGPLTGQPQEPGKVYRLGILSPGALPDPSLPTSPNLVPIALREMGYTDGQNLVIERRFAEGRIDRLPVLARELVRALGVADFTSPERNRVTMISRHWHGLAKPPHADAYVQHQILRSRSYPRRCST
jgi:hypothetical protein